MTILEFADFRCGHCKNALPIFKTFTQSHPDVTFVFRLFPLDGECNPHVEFKNGVSCRLARTAYCATEQNREWDVYDWIFENQERFQSPIAAAQTLREMGEELKLDAAALKKCDTSAKYDEVIVTHSNEAQKAGVQGTPSVFVNGKALPLGQTLPVLESLYEEISRSSPQ